MKIYEKLYNIVANSMQWSEESKAFVHGLGRLTDYAAKTLVARIDFIFLWLS